MDLFTRCPHCETVFRVTTAHLQASGGQVRCGRCHGVFDAFASLTAKSPGERPREVVAGIDQQTGDTAPDVAETEETAETAATPPGWETGSIDSAEAPALQVPSQQGDSPLKQDPATSLYEWEFKPTPKLRRLGLWLGLSALLLIGALLQAGYLFRTELMVSFPEVRPAYEWICEQLSCEIGLPRLAEQLNIDASDLQFVDPQRPNLVKLTALVRNRARVPVEYPAFELTLTNAQQQVVARRVFLPDEYLRDQTQIENGLGGRQELAVNLYLDTGPLRAAGYRIYLFYPPPT